ncbi:MAG: gamma carbonic anhydrase family protein [Proteobacteria bacterium]|nr:gamma carbonic anhydrase family protein [Pseudomonadota bacterium]
MRYKLDGIGVDFDPSTTWVAPSADIVGNVKLGPGSSVWWNAVIRGDNELISVGARSNVQDGSVLHTDPGYPLMIGEDVTIGHMCMLHGCTIGDGSLIGIGSIILNGAKIGKNCLVGANSLVTENKEFEDGTMIIGSPAKAVKKLSPEQLEGMAQNSHWYVERAKLYASKLELDD